MIKVSSYVTLGHFDLLHEIAGSIFHLRKKTEEEEEKKRIGSIFQLMGNESSFQNTK